MARVREVLAAFREAPVCNLDRVVGRRPFLILAPHPDDESLACGGLLAAARARGQQAYVAVLTDGSGSHPQSPSFPPARLKALREAEARAAVDALGLEPDGLVFLDQPDGRAPHDGPAFAAVVERLARWCRARHVCTVLTTWRHDPHCDHEAASKIADELCRRLAARHFACPVWGWTLDGDLELHSPVPNAVRVDIGAFREAKRRAVAAHRSQTTALISDSPYGFTLDPAFLELFDQPWEVFIEV